MAKAYDSIVNIKEDTLHITIGIFANYIPSIRKIPIARNKRFNNACKVIEHESKKLIEERYHDKKSDGNDLLSLLINNNKTLPIEEKMTNDELKYQAG